MISYYVTLGHTVLYFILHSADLIYFTYLFFGVIHPRICHFRMSMCDSLGILRVSTSTNAILRDSLYRSAVT